MEERTAMSTYEMASFNIRLDIPSDGENGWAFRKEHMLRLIRHYRWDVFGLQEARGNQLRDLAALEDYEVEGISRDHDPESEHCPVFITSRYSPRKPEAPSGCRRRRRFRPSPGALITTGSAPG